MQGIELAATSAPPSDLHTLIAVAIIIELPPNHRTSDGTNNCAHRGVVFILRCALLVCGPPAPPGSGPPAPQHLSLRSIGTTLYPGQATWTGPLQLGIILHLDSALIGPWQLDFQAGTFQSKGLSIDQAVH
mgnify:CR=1 FL=1